MQYMWVLTQTQLGEPLTGIRNPHLIKHSENPLRPDGRRATGQACCTCGERQLLGVFW